MPDIAEAPCLAVRDLTVRFGEFTAVQNISFDLTHGQVTAMCGLNGCGKSSALKAIRRLLPSTGTITLSGTDLHTLSEKQIAKHIGMLGQNPQAPDQMSVRELVSLGRFAHRSALGGLQPYDHKTISKALGATAVSELADNTLGTISGGQRQRAWLAMVLAQEAEILFLDEPTNHLDISHALSTLRLVQRQAREEGKTVLVVLHDLNLAAQFADRIMLMKRGRITADGPVDEVFCDDIISANFDIDCSVLKRPDTGRPYVLAQ